MIYDNEINSFSEDLVKKRVKLGLSTGKNYT